MVKRGRKTYGEDMKIKERYCELTAPFFKVLKEFLVSKNKADKKFAIEQLSKGFVKMIPQVLQGDSDKPLFPPPIYGGKSIQTNNSVGKDISTNTKN